MIRRRIVPRDAAEAELLALIQEGLAAERRRDPHGLEALRRILADLLGQPALSPTVH